MSSKRARTVLILVACALLVAAVPMFGQAVNGTLLGTLSDSSGAVVPGAQVTAAEVATGVVRTTQTNSSGNFVFADMPPGSYAVAAEAHGFKKVSRGEVRLDVNSTVRVDLTMQPGAVSETVEVTSAAPILQTDRADVGAKIEATQMQELPVGGANRNFQGLLALVPGTVRPHRDHSEFFNAQDTLSTEVNGQSREFNQLSIEGVNDDERTGLLQIYVPPAEAIETVDVTTSNYAAEFGRAGGAVTNVILKSGTNQFHGSAFEYNRVSALQARSYFNRAPNPFARTTYNYYGGTIGGPIIKNKTFFFFDLLRISDIRGQFNQLTVPTDAFRNGDLTAGGSNVYNPFTGNADGTGRQQFVAASAPGVATVQGRNGPVDAFNAACKVAAGCPNMIPTALFDPISLKLLALVPHANLTGLTNNYTQNTQLRKTPNSFDIKIDHNWTEKDRLAFRFSRAVQNVYQQPIFGLAGGPANSAFQGTGIQHEQSGALNATHIFSPTLLVEARFGVGHYRNIAQNADYGSTASKDIGIPGINLDPFTSGLASMDIQGGFSSPMVGYSASMPWDRGETNINFVNNWTKINGNHTFKWGADIRRLRDDLVQGQTFSPRGLFRFGTGTTQLNGGPSKTSQANNFGAFLIDQPTEVGRDVNVQSASWRETEAFFYGQDTWRFTSKLTVDAGLRWELYLPATPSHPGGYSNYDPTNNILVLAGVGGNPSNLGRETYYKYFAPRLGLAYQFTDKTVLRGGFGMSYEPFTNNQYAFNFPVRQNQDSVAANPFAIPILGGLPGTLFNGVPAPGQVAVSPSGTVVPHFNENYNVVDKHFQQPYVESWNLSVQQALPADFVLEAAYVGNHGVKIPVAYDLNAATAPSLCTAAEIAGGLAKCGGKNVGDIQGDNCAIGASTRPLCNQFGRNAGTTFLFKPTVSHYDSLQMKLNRRFKGGFLLTTSYTYGKEIGYRSKADNDDGSPDNYLDFQRNYAVMSRNRLHTFVQSYVYELPFGKNKPFLHSGFGSWLLGGWGVSGVLTRMSGDQLRFTDSGTTLSASGTTQVPNLVAPFNTLGGIDTALWFDPNSFAHVTTNGVLGNMKRYEFTGPGFFNLDAAAFRRFPVGERMGFEFRVEAFSVTNTPQFSDPDTNLPDANFGRIKGVNGGNRSLELSGRFSF